MKKIVNGVRYDADKAIEIGSESHGYAGDFRAWEATLYVTPKSRRYFLAGSGGPMSRFAQSAGQNEWTGGSDLIPMSKDEALEWAEAHLDADVVEEYFADMIEDA